MLPTVRQAAALHPRFGWLWELGFHRAVNTRERVKWSDNWHAAHSSITRRCRRLTTHGR